MALPIVNSSRYTTIIPSTGKEISFRSYLVKEEKILMVAMESKNQGQIIDAIKDVIKACIYDTINTSDLTIFDVEYLFLKLRSKSVGETVEVKIKCSHCETPNDVKVIIDDIKIPDISNEDNKTVYLSNNIGAVLKYPSIDIIKKYTEKDLKTVEGITNLICDCLDSIYDENNVYDIKSVTKKELIDFIDNLNSAQFAKLSSFFDTMPSLKHNVEFDCISCKEHNTIELKGIESFFS
jgi:hypothetical protein